MIFLLFLFLVFSLTRNLFEYKKNSSFYESYKNEYDKAKKENTSLKTQIIKNSDPNQVEKTIRNKLNLSKPDEVAVIIPNPTPTTIAITPTPAPAYQQWLNLFFQD